MSVHRIGVITAVLTSLARALAASQRDAAASTRNETSWRQSTRTASAPPALIGTVVKAAAAAMLIALGLSRPVSAQGGLLCDVGPADYRRCCKESYGQRPDLGLRARAEDIDACMKGSVRDEQSPAPTTGERSEDGASAEPRVPGSPSATSPAPASAGPIRRITCSVPGACEKGCEADEMTISAFCKVGSFPTLTPDGAVRCTTITGTEMPVVIFCAKS